MMKMRTMDRTIIIMIIMMMIMMMIEDKACKCEADIGVQESECSLNPTETQIKMRRIKKYFLIKTIEILLVVIRTIVTIFSGDEDDLESSIIVILELSCISVKEILNSK